jgi:HEAT repeat protein
LPEVLDFSAGFVYKEWSVVAASWVPRPFTFSWRELSRRRRADIGLNHGETVTKLQSRIQALDSGDPGARREAIGALKQWQEQEWDAAPPKVISFVVKSLQQQLQSEATQPFLRREIALIFASMGPRSEAAVPQLRELLKDSVPHGIREAAAGALGSIGKKARSAVPELIPLLATDRPALVIEGVRALGNIGCAEERVSAALVGLWTSPRSATIHLEVALALCKLRIQVVGLPRVLANTLVTSREAPLRKAAAGALACCNKTEPDVVPALLAAALKETDEDVRQTAEGGLRQMGLSHAKAAQVCAQQLKDSAAAESALRQSGPLAVPCLLGALDDDEPEVREKAVRILGNLGEAAAGAVTALTPVLQDGSREVRLAAAKSLWNITKNAELVVPTLIALLREKRAFASDATEARRRFLQTVMEALQRIGPAAKAGIPALLEKTKDENRIVSESARTALKEIGHSA